MQQVLSRVQGLELHGAFTKFVINQLSPISPPNHRSPDRTEEDHDTTGIMEYTGPKPSSIPAESTFKQESFRSTILVVERDLSDDLSELRSSNEPDVKAWTKRCEDV